MVRQKARETEGSDLLKQQTFMGNNCSPEKTTLNYFKSGNPKT